jgi:hypothetical protein
VAKDDLTVLCAASRAIEVLTLGVQPGRADGSRRLTPVQYSEILSAFGLSPAQQDAFMSFQHEIVAINSMAVYGGRFGGRISLIGCVQPVAMSEQSEQEPGGGIATADHVAFEGSCFQRSVVLLWHG